MTEKLQIGQILKELGLSDLVNTGNGAGRITRYVQFAELVLSDRGNVTSCNCEQGCARKGRAALGKCPHTAADEIAEYVGARERRHLRTAVNVPADYGSVSIAVIVVEDGQGETSHWAV